MVLRQSLLSLLVLQALLFALAHDHGDQDQATATGQGTASITSSRLSTGTGGIPAKTEPPRSYFSYPEHGNLMLGHIVLMTVGWVFALPISVMLSLARSRLAFLAQISFLGLHSIATLLGAIYANKTPSFYGNNSHKPTGWLVTLVVVLQSILAFVAFAIRFHREDGGVRKEQTGFLPMTTEALEQHHQQQQEIGSNDQHRFSTDSGGYTASEPERSQSVSSTATYTQEDQQRLHEYEADHFNFRRQSEKRGLLNGEQIERAPTGVAKLLSSRTLRLFEMIHHLIDRTILLMGFVAFITGIAIYGGVFRGRSVFNGLAHTIKGGIFFWYGLLTLARWMGCFSEYGWAWNVRPPASVVGSRKAQMPTAEFVESFVMFFYGSSNVFLEHLAAWGKTWSPMDLEHISITIMFFGGGLCGMLVESARVRDLLNSVVLISPAAHGPQPIRDQLKPPKTYPFSLNPMPALVIFLLGLMMSAHHQHSVVSTMVHKQWGTLFVGFAVARAVTYILVYLSPPHSYLPSRPPSELISSFCLISGGIIFMASNRDTVNSLEAHNIHAMFPFTVTMGLTSFLMAWAIIVLAIKGWAVQRNSQANSGSFHKLNTA